jgi:hypothetical protein
MPYKYNHLMNHDPVAPHRLELVHMPVGSPLRFDPASSDGGSDVCPFYRLDSCSLGRIEDSTGCRDVE